MSEYRGTTSDDFLVVPLKDATLIDGGEGIDTLRIDPAEVGYYYDLDLLAGYVATFSDGFEVSSASITGIENITGTGGEDFFYGDHASNILAGDAANDGLIGRGGNDQLFGDGRLELQNGTLVVVEDAGGGGDDQLYGGAGHDRLVGGGGADRLFGDADDDLLFGGAGSDLLSGWTGNDELHGGDGGDKVSYYAGNAGSGVTVSLLLQGSAQNTGSQGSDLLTGIEHLAGTAFSDVLIGDAGDNALWSGGTPYDDAGTPSPNDDVIDGGAGNDLIAGDRGNHVLEGGADRDTVALDDGTLFPDLGHEGHPSFTLSLESQGSAQDTGWGSWTISGFENVSGHVGDDHLTGDGAANVLAGWTGADVLSGGGGDDLLLGDGTIMQHNGAIVTSEDTFYMTYVGSSADYLDGGAGGDRMVGGYGNDTYIVDAYDDVVDEAENAGVDEVRTSYTEYTLSGGVENLTGITDVMQTLTGNAGNNSIAGGAGIDILDGGAGNDVLDGGDGDDLIHMGSDLYGPDGTETATGGSGADTFIIGPVGASDGFGRVLDFNEAEGDRIGFSEVYTPYTSYAAWPVKAAFVFTGPVDAAGFGFGTSLPRTDLGGDLIQVCYVHSGGNTLVIVDADADMIYGENDYVLELAGTVTLTAAAIGSVVEVGSTAGDAIDGDRYDDFIYGAGGDDVLRGGGGPDDFYGGPGDDRIESGDVYFYPLYAGDEMYGGDGNDTIVGGMWVDLLEGEDGADLLDGMGENDTMRGGNGDDVLRGGSGDDFMEGGEGNDRLEAGQDGGTLYGEAGDDWLVASSDEDSAHGGEGTDTLDYSGITSGGVVVSLDVRGYQNTGASGQDSISGIENLIGTAHADILAGDDAANLIDGGAGADRMDGRLGDDVYVVDDVYDTVTEAAGAGTDEVRTSLATYTLAAAIENLTGLGSAAQSLTGNALSNRIDGGAGADTMTGGLGSDTYVVDNAGDKVVELAGQGIDTVESAVTFTLANTQLEHLTLTGAAHVNATGNAGANSLYGNAGNNRIDGGLGADRMSGGDGDDVYYVDDAGDQVLENSATGGIDTVYSGIDFTLAYQQLEKLFLTGTAANATGNGLNNTLVGNGSANVLNGMGGIDTMNGGAGDDTYHVDASGDTVIEVAGGGTDTVMSSATFALNRAYEIENLVLTGTSAVNALGNHLDNRIEGNNNNNILNGSTGADTMIGKGNNDIYYVDNAGDLVVEEAGGGVDTVHSSISYTLAAHVENGGFTNEAALDITGNELVNRIYGNGADNVLDGGAGADYMTGRGGNDTYVVDNAGDRVQETRAIDGAADNILASVSYSLGGIYVETLELTGTSAIDATGNGLANTLIGNRAANKLYGLGGDDALDGAGGDDWLFGGAGKDQVSGGAGKDRFYFDTPLSGTTNVDQLLDFSVADDAMYLDRSVFTGLATGTLSAAAFVNGTAAGDAGDRIVYDGATGNVWYDADGSGAGEAVLFATVTAGTALTNLDFYGYGG